MGKEKVKKPFFKRVWVWIGIVVIVLIIIGSVAGGGSGGGENTTTTNNIPKATNSQQDDAGQQKQDDKQKQPKQQKQDLKAKYKKIKVGDTLTGKGGTSKEDVLKLLGKPDSTSKSSMGKDGTMVIATWSDLWSSGQSVTVTFINKHVSDKNLTQFN